METHIIFKNMQSEEDIREYAEKKLVKLNKYLASISNIKLELSKVKSKSRQHNFAVQVTINTNGFLIRGEHKDESIKAAIDEVIETMERQIAKYKKRYEISKGRGLESIRVPESVSNKEKGEPEEGDILKVKRFKIKPMSVEQAIDQMEFLGHDFFIFASIEDKSINVVYRRKDGNYGLILPELA